MRAGRRDDRGVIDCGRWEQGGWRRWSVHGRFFVLCRPAACMLGRTCSAVCSLVYITPSVSFLRAPSILPLFVVIVSVLHTRSSPSLRFMLLSSE